MAYERSTSMENYGMTLTGGNRITGRKTCFQYYIVLSKFHMNWPGREHGVSCLI